MARRTPSLEYSRAYYADKLAWSEMVEAEFQTACNKYLIHENPTPQDWVNAVDSVCDDIHEQIQAAEAARLGMDPIEYRMRVEDYLYERDYGEHGVFAY